MITCHLTKLETAVEQLKKAYPKLKPTDCARIASALVLTGRHALALYDGEQYRWPDDYDRLTKQMLGQLEIINQSVDPAKKTKTTVEEEPVIVTVGLMPNYSAGERILSDRKDLAAKLSEILGAGVEFVYSASDLGWQWALDRANWATISGGELHRRIKIKASFTEGAVGIEMGTTTKKRSAAKKEPAAAAVPAEEPEEAEAVAAE